MKNGIFIAIACMAVLAGACSPSTDFLVLKHGRGYKGRFPGEQLEVHV